MAKQIFTADTHLKPYASDNVELESGITLKLQELLNNIRQMYEYAKSNNIDTVNFGGDLCHHKDTVHTRPFNLFKNIVAEYSDVIRSVFIPGNHDGNPQFPGENAVSLLCGLNNVEVYMKPTVVGNITYIPDCANLYDEIKSAKPNDILISHFPLSEASTEAGISIKTKYSKKDLKKFKLVLIGDYHTHQTIDHIHYPGSIFPTTRGETGPKGFIVFDDETLETEFIEVHGHRQYINVELTETTDIVEFTETMKELNESNDFVIIRSTRKDVPTELKELTKDSIFLDRSEIDDMQRGISSNMDIRDQMKKYLEIQNINEEDQEYYLEVALTCLDNITV